MKKFSLINLPNMPHYKTFPANRTAGAIIALACCVFVQGCAEKKSHIEEIKDRNLLRVVTRAGLTTYYRDKDGENGLEYKLVSLFSTRLGVDFEFIIAGNVTEIIDYLASGKADIAAAGLIRSFRLDDPLDYGPGYQWVTKQVVYRKGYKRPSSLDDIHPYQLHLANDTFDEAELARLKEAHPALSWAIHNDKNNHDLLGMIEDGKIPYGVVYSNELAYSRLLNPEVRTAFSLTPPHPLGWAVKKNQDDHSLIKSIRQFYGEINNNDQLAELIEQIYGPVEFFDYVDSRKFIDRYYERLPDLKPYFKDAAIEFDFDWRLLAATSYQESHWDKKARSATGVRGLMMLTRSTARQVGITDRLDPEQSIRGGAKYLASLMDKVPERIDEPDHTRLALAAYNVGFGHLEDARILTQRHGGNPDAWADVKNYLPLLSKEKWHKQTKHGYARGHEPVKFVENIRKYYTVLIQLTHENVEPTPTPRLVEHEIIDSPVL